MAYLRGLWAFHGQLFAKETFGEHLNVSKKIHPRGITGIVASGGVTPSSSENTKRVYTRINKGANGILRKRKGKGVDTMTEKTGIYSARVPKEVLGILGGIEKRKAIEGLARVVSEGFLGIEDGEIVVNASIPSVDTKTENVDTSDYCEGCPYIENALDTSKFDEACEFKGLDRQQALNRCAQMLWR